MTKNDFYLIFCLLATGLFISILFYRDKKEKQLKRRLKCWNERVVCISYGFPFAKSYMFVDTYEIANKIAARLIIDGEHFVKVEEPLFDVNKAFDKVEKKK